MVDYPNESKEIHNSTVRNPHAIPRGIDKEPDNRPHDGGVVMDGGGLGGGIASLGCALPLS